VTEDKTNNVEKNGIKRREKVTTALSKKEKNLTQILKNFKSPEHFHSFYQFNVRNLKYKKIL
jgi:GTP1/Obg family GTP-binding protein